MKINRPQHLKSVNNHGERYNTHGINQLKNQIKYVLNIGLQGKNDTIERYITESFNINNPDPMYVFVLPDASNSTLVFHRSNFSDISFPNTTSVQAMYNFLKTSKFAHFYPTQEERIAKQLALDQRFFVKYKEFMSSENDLHEAESLKIIAENVRTEKNVVKFMEKINEDADSITIEANNEPDTFSKQQSTDYPALIRHIHSKEHIGNYALTKDIQQETEHKQKSWPTNEKVSWDDFGLSGWVGSINEHHEHPEENGYDIFFLLLYTATHYKIGF